MECAICHKELQDGAGVIYAEIGEFNKNAKPVIADPHGLNRETYQPCFDAPNQTTVCHWTCFAADVARHALQR